jgi:hypothetical protein
MLVLAILFDISIKDLCHLYYYMLKKIIYLLHKSNIPKYCQVTSRKY